MWNAAIFVEIGRASRTNLERTKGKLGGKGHRRELDVLTRLEGTILVRVPAAGTDIWHCRSSVGRSTAFIADKGFQDE